MKTTMMTSAAANKLLRKLMDEVSILEEFEQKNSVFICSTTEKIEDVRPQYDFKEANARLLELGEQIRSVKHAINNFNLTTEVLPGLTIDMALVKIPQLSKRKQTLSRLISYPPKRRYSNTASGIDYAYVNYNPEDVEAEYKRVCDELSALQIALDTINTQVQFAVPEF